MKDIVWNAQVLPYVRSLGKRDQWRFSALGYEIADFEQEAFFVYDRCLKTYGTVLGENGRLCPRFKSSLFNLLTNLSIKATDSRNLCDYTDDLTNKDADISCSMYEEDEYLQDLVKSAPSDITEALKLLLKSPAEITELLSGLPEKIKEEATALLSNKISRGMASNKTLSVILGYNRFRNDLLERTKKYIMGQPTGGNSCIIKLRTQLN